MPNFLEQIKQKFLTLTQQDPNFYKSREITTPQTREIRGKRPVMESLVCPACQSQNYVRRGLRKKKLELVQLYLCKECGKSFTPHVLTRGKHYPLETILDAMSFYYLGYPLAQACERVNRGNWGDKRDKGLTKIQPSTLSAWLKEFEGLCKFSRFREFAKRQFSPEEMVVTATLAHQQLFRYRFHQAKCGLIMQEDFRHHKLGALKEFLELVPSECPHQFFQTGLRASEAPLTFSKKQMIVRGKQNYANALCTFVLQSVKERKARHEALQRFMLYNDSVTVATEVPVYITRDDLLHMQTQLGFQIYNKKSAGVSASKTSTTSAQGCPVPSLSEVEDKSLPTIATLAKGQASATTEAIPAAELPRLITGHIDILQIRNGQIHILDYKPEAAKIQPIDQLTLYAMALSRLTGLRLFEFKCAWFDENDFFEFYPLHVLHKPKKGGRRRKVYTMEGIYEINKSEKKVESIRPKT